MWFEGIAWAQSAAPAAASPDFFQQLISGPLPLLVMIGAVMYFMIIRPQSQKASEHAKMLRELKKNDEVVTTGGIIGRVTELGEKVVTVEIAPNVRVRIERPQIASLSAYGKAPAASKKDKGD
jgi:preprotein translocase subunit YajC